MFKKSEPPKQLVRLASRPLLTDLQKYAADVVRAREKSLQVFWNSADGLSGYTLAITSTPGSNEPQWRLSSQVGPVKKDLWFYVSADINKIFSMCIASLGEDLAEALAADARAVAAGSTAATLPAQGILSSTDYSNVGNQQRSTAPLPLVSPTDGLTGNLAVLHITNLLQSISMGKMTGRLHVEPVTGPVEVFFDSGSPVHAVSRQSTGEESFLEVVALNNGSFVFEPGLKTDTRSITHALDSLILKGIQILDCQGIIDGADVTIDSVVHRNQQGLSEAAFEQRVSQGAPIDIASQKKFYISIDDKMTIRQLTDNLKLPRSEWIPIVSNLIKVGLASFTTVGAAAKKSIFVEPKRLDLVVVEQFAHHLKKPDTGAYTYPAFNYFLHQEFLRYKRTEAPMSVILLDIRLQKPGAPPTRGMINPQTVSQVVQNIALFKRELDLITHYEGQAMAVLLPHTHAHEAVVFGRRIIASVSEAKFLVGMEKLVVSLVLGIAGIPGDVVTTGELLAAAEMAKEKANSLPEGLQLFSELS